MTNRSDWADRVIAPAAFNRSAAPVAAGLAMLLAGGCVSNQPAPNTVRNTAQTAPADLQLTCAAAAATSLGVDSNTVLPISSSQLDPQKYQVDLDAEGTRATCIVDATGNVLSVTKV
jgi:hypothetical protein